MNDELFWAERYTLGYDSDVLCLVCKEVIYECPTNRPDPTVRDMIEAVIEHDTVTHTALAVQELGFGLAVEP